MEVVKPSRVVLDESFIRESETQAGCIGSGGRASRVYSEASRMTGVADDVANDRDQDRFDKVVNTE